MASPDSELFRLKHALMSSGWDYLETEEIMDRASADVNELILDVIENAVAEAIDYAQSIGAEEFIEEIDIRDMGGYYQIGTISGKTDYSTPPRQMLPDLLKNAETSPSGNKTKVIPIGGKSTTIKGDIFSVMRERQKKIDETRATLLNKNSDGRSDRANLLASQFRSILQRNLVSVRRDRKVSDSNAVNPKDFRTASSTQDASQDWVYPAKELDMTGYLMDANSNIMNTLDYSVNQLINSYIQEYA